MAQPSPGESAQPACRPGYGGTLPPAPGSAATARSLVRVALATWALEELADPTALIVSELMSNAVRHARCDDIAVAIDRTGRRTVRVAVTDSSGVLPVPRASGHDDETGRGLALVSALAQSWGIEEHHRGKTVWAVVR
ncbi:ATP-binding protein [Streptomyces sp. LP05-1]|uniref:ATP-binding protein n=1 Tax=Streptomyces pyxinae TaxID=2970734 RepID=A0ABT2CEM3_9ACTN|nr:ATP-binding protein [Streptomyces sp. LP05-1]MCS0635868.1 ATP-binding protein [Streptomyces sp. LP05-1]